MAEKKKSTTELDKILGKMNPDTVEEYLKEFDSEMYEGDNAFSNYMKEVFRKHGFTQQEIFLRADMPQRYGYKIISGEKHTAQRDVILRVCLASQCNLTETNRALKLYGVSELYSKIARDAVVITAINSRVWDIDDVNDLLRSYGFRELYGFTID